MAKLVLSLNGTVLQQHFIDKPCIRIGRDADSDIVIDDPLVSREHARIVSVGKDQIVEDMQSGNGTRVNGRPLARKILRHRDVIELGAHHLCYLSARMAANVDFEQTMLIEALPRDRVPADGLPPVNQISVRAGREMTPVGSVKVLSGSGRHAAGESVLLDRVVTTFGIPGEQLVVIARRPQGYFLTHVDGGQYPRVNQQMIGSAPCALRNGDLIEAAGYTLELQLAAKD